MKVLRYSASFFVWLIAASGGFAMAQSPARTSASAAAVTSVQGFSQSEGAVLEIRSTRPLVPEIRKLSDPPRLVIDLPNAQLSANSDKRVDFRTAQIEGVRLNQFQQNPPIARIVVDLAKPVPYSWDTIGNRLLLHLRSPQESAATATPALHPASTVPSVKTIEGSRLPPGASVTAGSDAAVVSLARGGEVRVCPGSTVSVTPSQNNRSLMLGMSTGALEAHYALDASADSILTPDFRILLVGPGEFHYAFSADSRGNTCVQALPGNTASVIVSELLGDRTYQVKPSERVLFHAGQLRDVADPGSASCGCPPPQTPVMLASSSPAPASQGPAAVPLGTGNSETAALPALKPNDLHVQVDAPFVFRANDPAPASQPIRVEMLPLRSPAPAESVDAAVLAPPQAKPVRHGFFGKLRGFFASIFG